MRVESDIVKGKQSAFSSESPEFTYSGGAISRIDYADGSYKLFTYTSGKVSQVEHVFPDRTLTKSFIYSGETLTDIVWS